MKRVALMAVLLALASAPAFATGFTNGDFELGNSSGWLTGTGYRASVDNPSLTAAMVLPGGSLYVSQLNHSSIVTSGAAPNTGGGLNQVYSGTYSWRVEDTTTGGYASAIQQTALAYTDPNIFFAWAAVLEGAHDATQAATVKIFLTDVTTGTPLISREYNAADGGGGVDARFHTFSGFFWTDWQIEQLTLPAASFGHDMMLSILASDCQPTGHAGYLYLDGFGSVAPPPTGNVPEPGSILLLGSGLAFVARKLRRQR